MARRKLIWTRMAPAMTSLTPVSAVAGGQVESQDLLQTFRTQAGITRGPVGVTVMRVRLKFGWVWEGLNGTPDLVLGNPIFFGVRRTSFVDLAAREIAEVVSRGPQTETHDDWMAWGMLFPKVIYRDAAGTGITGSSGWEEVDVRSMRKLDELDDTLELCVQATNTSGLVALPMVVASSVLLALP